MAAALTRGMLGSMFKYLGIVFHESGGMAEALARLLQNCTGPAALGGSPLVCQAQGSDV